MFRVTFYKLLTLLFTLHSKKEGNVTYEIYM